jgi:cobalt/nickel transport system ATP-binding protein
MIRFENVTFAYEKGKPVVQSVSFHVQRGETVGLIGANGAGKSTVMKQLLGLAGPGAGVSKQFFDGTILVDGLEVLPAHIAGIRKKLGFVLQNSDNQMFMPTVLEDMMFGLLNSGMTRQEAEERVDSTLESLGLMDLKYLYNHKISGGEKRMAAVATVLAMEPEVLLMDEPTSALDPYNRRVVIRAINSLPQTKIITSHDLDMIYDTCSRVILLAGGKVAADGPVREILRDEKLLTANRMELPLRFQGA